MTVTILLIRHAAHADLGQILSGRTVGGPLTEAGVEQAHQLGARLAAEPIASVHTSPVRRARQTAEYVAAVHGQEPLLAEELNEIDFGVWAGRAFADLERDPAWTRWNEQRADAGAPNGEMMKQVQLRVWTYLQAAARRFPGKIVAMVSHCDPIRAAITAVLGLSLDNLLRIEVAPASVSRIEVGEWGARVLSLNEVRA